MCLNPLKRVNSILTSAADLVSLAESMSLNPLKRVNSILTSLHPFVVYAVIILVSIPSSGSIQFLLAKGWKIGLRSDGSLNPLKRVNSILTKK